jgi:hypothetical protein
LAEDASSEGDENKWWSNYAYPGMENVQEADIVQANETDVVPQVTNPESEQAFLFSVTPRCDTSVNVQNVRSTLQLGESDQEALQKIGYLPYKEQAWIGSQVTATPSNHQSSFDTHQSSYIFCSLILRSYRVCHAPQVKALSKTHSVAIVPPCFFPQLAYKEIDALNTAGDKAYALGCRSILCLNRAPLPRTFAFQLCRLDCIGIKDRNQGSNSFTPRFICTIVSLQDASRDQLP